MKMAAKDAQLLAEFFTESNPLRVAVITMSDRAASGEYEDRSGPRLVEHLEDFLQDKDIPRVIERNVLSDDRCVGNWRFRRYRRNISLKDSGQSLWSADRLGEIEDVEPKSRSPIPQENSVPLRPLPPMDICCHWTSEVP